VSSTYCADRAKNRGASSAFEGLQTSPFLTERAMSCNHCERPWLPSQTLPASRRKDPAAGRSRQGCLLSAEPDMMPYLTLTSETTAQARQGSTTHARLVLS
jgi:hypothetical protein